MISFSIWKSENKFSLIINNFPVLFMFSVSEKHKYKYDIHTPTKVIYNFLIRKKERKDESEFAIQRKSFNRDIICVILCGCYRIIGKKKTNWILHFYEIHFFSLAVFIIWCMVCVLCCVYTQPKKIINTNVSRNVNFWKCNVLWLLCTCFMSVQFNVFFLLYFHTY